LPINNSGGGKQFRLAIAPVTVAAAPVPAGTLINWPPIRLFPLANDHFAFYRSEKGRARSFHPFLVR